MNKRALQALFGDDEDDGVRIDPEAQLMRLREAAPRFAPPNGESPFPFSAGDVVTPRKDGTIRGKGEPHIVIEVNPSAEPSWRDEPGSTGFGSRFNMRVLCITNGDIVPFWVEAAHFEPYPTA